MIKKIKFKLNIIGLLAGIIFSVVFTYITLKDINFEAFTKAFFHVSPLYLSLFVVFNIVMILMRSIRWTLLVRNIPNNKFKSKYIFSVGLIGFAAILIFPLRIGEFVRPYLLSENSKNDSSKRLTFSSLLGAVTLERITDGLIVSLTIIFIFINRGMHGSAMFVSVAGVGLVFFIALIILVIAMFFPSSTAEFFAKITFLNFLAEKSEFFSGIRKKWFYLTDEAAEGIKIIKNPFSLVILILLSMSYWFANAVGIYFLARGFGLNLGLQSAGLVMSFVVLGIFLPSAPGYIGNYHQFAKLGLSVSVAQNLLSGKGMAFVVTLHALQLFLYLMFGLLGIFAGGLKKQK